MSNHSTCEENLYWGSARLGGFNRTLYNLLTMYKSKHKYRGHIVGDKLFWGDICKTKLKYVRNFVFANTNTLKACPYMPYHDPARPFVNHWFASTEGPDIHTFNRALSERNQDILEEEGGACIMYTHLACGFAEEGSVHPYFKNLMQRLSKKNGWFVPVGTLLDFLLEIKGSHLISNTERKQLERRWLLHKLRVGRS